MFRLTRREGAVRGEFRADYDRPLTHTEITGI